MAEGLARAGVAIAPAPPAVRYSLRTRVPEGLPPILTAAAYANGHALCLGPDEWLLILPTDAPAPAIAFPNALIDIGHRQVALLIEGAAAQRLLQCRVMLDLAPAAFPPGKATRTLCDGIEIVLWRLGEEAFRVEVWRSFAPHLLAALALAMEDLTG